MAIRPGTAEFAYTREMAARGYVAAMITPVYSGLSCGSLSTAAQLVFDGPSSALAVLCARAAADCAAGVAVHGFSLGGLQSPHTFLNSQRTL